MKRIGIAITDIEDWTAQALRQAVIKAGFDPFMFRLHDVSSTLLRYTGYNVGNIDLASLDGIIVRDVGGRGAEDMSFRFDVLCNLEDSGVVIVNPPPAIQNAANKHMSSYLFKKYGLPTPCTAVTADPEVAFDFVRKWGRAVMKPIFGFKGMDIHCIIDDELSRQLLVQALKRRGVLYLQQYVPNQGRDIRAFVVDGRVAGAIYRTALKGSWISNLSRGGTPERCSVTWELETLACEATEAVGAVYAGVDLVEGQKGLSILEVNGTPSGRGIFEACGIDVADDIVRYVLREIDC